jgi:hypothetical protein
VSLITEQAQASIERVGFYNPSNIQGEGDQSWVVTVETSQGNTYRITLRADNEDQAGAFALEAVEMVELGRVVKIQNLADLLGISRKPKAIEPDPVEIAQDGSVVEERERGSLEVDPEEAAARKARAGEASRFLKEYTGHFPFLLEMKERLFGQVTLGNRDRSAVGQKANRRLSDRQVEAVLKCKRIEEEKVAARADRLMDEYEALHTPAAKERRVAPWETESGIDLTDLPQGTVRNGTDHLYVAAENDEGSLTFLKIDRPIKGRWSGFAFVRLVVGGAGVADRLGSQAPGRTYQGGAQVVLRNVMADPKAAVARFGQEIGRCGICGLVLTDEESRRIGIGPVCRSRG